MKKRVKYIDIFCNNVSSQFCKTLVPITLSVYARLNFGYIIISQSVVRIENCLIYKSRQMYLCSQYL